jgi:hypothetical protein
MNDEWVNTMAPFFATRSLIHTRTHTHLGPRRSVDDMTQVARKVMLSGRLSVHLLCTPKNLQVALQQPASSIGQEQGQSRAAVSFGEKGTAPNLNPKRRETRLTMGTTSISSHYRRHLFRGSRA